ncbi:serine/threonine-protein kinase [Actinomadura craniellae]|uniref:serine/threonine-protein kinase n=1 Tax=Actinomadura craniellae TaxID=2231787 RepID=UPI001F2FD029|nr:serine/threonine-protein kinase [Actinomadura craniellae]
MSIPASVGRYRTDRVLGSGAFASVWLGHDDALDAKVAIKVLSGSLLDDLDVRNRFHEEARILRRADSERLVRVHDIGELPDGRPYFVMSYADRGTLADRMRERPLSVAETLAIAEDIAYGVAVINRLGVIHRDLKPSNVLFQSTPDGGERLLIADLGLAKAIAHASGAFTLPVGTPGYMSPEQARFGGGLDVRADVYGLGALTYHMLTGRPPGPAPVTKPPSALREGLTPEFDRVILRALEVERDNRWGTAQEFAEALAGLRPASPPVDDDRTVLDRPLDPGPAGHPMGPPPQGGPGYREGSPPGQGPQGPQPGPGYREGPPPGPGYREGPPPGQGPQGPQPGPGYREGSSPGQGPQGPQPGPGPHGPPPGQGGPPPGQGPQGGPRPGQGPQGGPYGPANQTAPDRSDSPPAQGDRRLGPGGPYGSPEQTAPDRNGPPPGRGASPDDVRTTEVRLPRPPGDDRTMVDRPGGGFAGPPAGGGSDDDRTVSLDRGQFAGGPPPGGGTAILHGPPGAGGTPREGMQGPPRHGGQPGRPGAGKEQKKPMTPWIIGAGVLTVALAGGLLAGTLMSGGDDEPDGPRLPADFVTVKDASGKITAAVPRAWPRQPQPTWNPADVGLADARARPVLRATPDFNGFRQTAAKVPGVFVGLTTDVAQGKLPPAGASEHPQCTKAQPQRYTGPANGLSGTITRYTGCTTGTPTIVEIGLTDRTGKFGAWVRIKQVDQRDVTKDVLDNLRLAAP